MWTRAELKTRAKDNLRRYYWPALVISMICAFFGSGGKGAGTGVRVGANTSQEYNIDIIGNLSGDPGSIIDEITEGFGEIAGSINPIMISALLVSVFIGIVIGLALSIFVGPVIEVGKNRFYMESRLTGRAAGIDCLIWGFKNHYLNLVWTMFLRNLIVVLSTFFCIIPGIYFAYSYYMVPYILAENPDMKASDALQMSKDMMNGHKLNTWVLEVSFFGWWIVGAMACGVGTFLVIPYYDATIAELYAVLREGFSNYLNGFGAEPMGAGYGRGYTGYQNSGWHQPYDQPYNQPYDQPYQEMGKPSYGNDRQTGNMEQKSNERGGEVKRSEGGPGRGYYLNGEFHPYTEDELNQLEQNDK